VIPFLGFFSANMIVYWAGWTTNWKLFVAVLIGLAVLALQVAFRRDKLPPMDWTAGAWVLPWLGALALISYLGSFGPGQGVLGLGSGAAVLLAVSAVCTRSPTGCASRPSAPTRWSAKMPRSSRPAG
jgi:hypothetical protein